MAGEFDGCAAVKEPEIKLEFEMSHRDHPTAPETGNGEEWLYRNAPLKMSMLNLDLTIPPRVSVRGSGTALSEDALISLLNLP
jgi:hypothetical protein